MMESRFDYASYAAKDSWNCQYKHNERDRGQDELSKIYLHKRICTAKNSPSISYWDLLDDLLKIAVTYDVRKQNKCIKDKLKIRRKTNKMAWLQRVIILVVLTYLPGDVCFFKIQFPAMKWYIVFQTKNITVTTFYISHCHRKTFD